MFAIIVASVLLFCSLALRNTSCRRVSVCNRTQYKLGAKSQTLIEEILNFNSAALARPHLVVASKIDSNTSWLDQHFPDWSKSVYVADNPEAEWTVPQNKGREAMVYLT